MPPRSGARGSGRGRGRSTGAPKRRQPDSVRGSTKKPRSEKKRAPTRKEKEDEKDLFFASESEEFDMDNVMDGGELKKKEAESESDSEDFDDETPEERRLRLAKQVLTNLELDKPPTDSDESDEEDFEDGVDLVDRQLQKSVAQARNKLTYPAAAKLAERKIDASCVRVHRGHRLAVTCIAASEDAQLAFTGSKDATMIRWDVETGKKIWTFKRAIKGHKMPGSTSEVLALSVSSDGRYLASGGRDKMVRIWDCRTNTQVQSFARHMDAVSSLAFHGKGHFLYSGSFDRTINVWNMENLSFVQTLFGHTDVITDLDCLDQERCVTSGQDKTVRLWKVQTESQLMFRGGPLASIDCVRMLNANKFFAGSQDGSVSCWKHDKKKPSHLQRNAHNGQWVSSVAAQRYADVVASGSCDGFVRLWQWNTRGQNDRISPLHAVPLAGYVNGMTFAQKGKLLLCGVGHEHKYGRWNSMKGKHNGLAIINLRGSASADDSDSEEADDITNTSQADEDEDDEESQSGSPAHDMSMDAEAEEDSEEGSEGPVDPEDVQDGYDDSSEDSD